MCWNILTALNTLEVFRMGYNEQQELGIYDVLDEEITILDGSWGADVDHQETISQWQENNNCQ